MTASHACGLINRWNPLLYNGFAFIHALLDLVEQLPDDFYRHEGRGRKPKRDVKVYLILLCVKEYLRLSLRGAEEFVELLLKVHIDHSVLHYWEKKLEPIASKLVELAGKRIEELIGYDYSCVDSTKFVSWQMQCFELHVLARKASKTIYVAKLDIASVGPSKLSLLVEGKGKLFADRWYDSNKFIGQAFKLGYEPLIKPNRKRCKGFWRKKARKIWKFKSYEYKNRSVVEGLFGALTVWFGDRLKTRLESTTRFRIACRVLCYNVRILVRAKEANEEIEILFIGIFRHAPRVNKI